MTPEVLEGAIERITYYNPETGYCVLRLKADRRVVGKNRGDDGLVTVVGVMAELQPGETLRLSGQWTSHPDFGRQFRAEIVTQVAPTTVEGIRRYLGSGLIKGVGQRTAEKIVDYFGERTLEVLDTNPTRLHDVPGIKRNAIDGIIQAWSEQRTIKDVMLFLQSHGISTGLAFKIFKQYGDNSIPVVRADPYQLARDVIGIGFKTADKIARDLGMPPDSPERMAAGVVYALNQHVNNGHTYAPHDELIKQAAELLDAQPELLESAINRLQTRGEVIVDDVPRGEEKVRAIYLPGLYYSEIGVSKRLANMAHNPASSLLTARTLDWDAFFKALASEDKIRLTDQQRDAVKAIVTNKVSVLTGGPGTGKTTTLRAVIRMLEVTHKSYALASPTGRAAKRLGEATGRTAQTIHRLLAYSPQDGWGYNEDSPLDVNAVILDETSMLDLVLFYNVLKALTPETHLLLVGDVDQLPSVGAGDVLRDVINSGAAYVTRLQTIFRQSETSLIVANAHRINHGELPDLSNKGSDFYIFREEDPDAAAELVVDLVKNRIPQKFGYNPDNEIQVLSPMYRGSVGVQALNTMLQAALNPPGRAAERKLFGTVFRVGDRVMQTKNNYNKEVYNGDIGRIHSLDMTDQTMTVIIDNHYIEYDWSECDELTHAFCISTHKSQGAEYPVVVLPLMTQHYMMLQRNLVYTAITRAKSLVVLVGSQRALAMAVHNDKVAERYSGLRHRLA